MVSSGHYSLSSMETYTCPQHGEQERDHFYWSKPAKPTHAPRRTCKERQRDRMNGDEGRYRNLWARYRLRPEQFHQMIVDQGGLCACCGVQVETWHVDHDHACCEGRNSCGKCVRALLCGPCNTTLGHAQDSVERLEALIAYLS